MDILAAITVEIGLDIDVFSGGTEQLLDRRKLGPIVSGVNGVKFRTILL